MEKKYNYRIYASVLNSFQRLLDSEIDAEDFSNVDSESGDYRRSPDEIFAEREQDLLDLINRVPREPIEAADRGTAFNEIVDLHNSHLVTPREDVVVQRLVDNFNVYGYRAEINGFTFDYDKEICYHAFDYFNEAIPQYLCEGELSTRYGLVQLYGYADYIFQNKVVDLKTCGRYDFGKYQHNWQKELYPYCLVQSGDMQECNMFEFYVVQMKNPTKAKPVITGNIYREEYNYNHEEAKVRLRQITERFINWLEAHRSLITNEKIFGGN